MFKKRIEKAVHQVSDEVAEHITIFVSDALKHSFKRVAEQPDVNRLSNKELMERLSKEIVGVK